MSSKAPSRLIRETGGNRFIDHDAQIEDLVVEICRGLRDLRRYAEETDRALDLGAITVDTKWTRDARLISVNVAGDLAPRAEQSAEGEGVRHG